MTRCLLWILLTSAACRAFTVATPYSLTPLRVHKRSSFLADELYRSESVHIPENELDHHERHIVSADSKIEDGTDIDVEEAETTVSPPHDHHSANDTPHEDHSIHVASWQWDYVRTPFIYTAVVIMAGLCKIGFHHAEVLSSILPESCMLIVLGIIVGTIVHFTHSREMLPQFTPKAFFLFLLPPIVLESSYSLHDRAFFSNLGTIILYAVVGTILNCFIIGLALYGLTAYEAVSGIHLSLVECLVFSALISAVDPVAVLAIFQEIGVNKNLYFLVFGESLLNDAVTIVLYMMMVGFSKAEYITAEQISLGFAAFICVSLGGLAIGILMGVVTALITKNTEDVRVVEPLAMLGIAYLSYLLAEMVHFSGIISIIGCGIVQAHYASKNISDKSKTTVKYFTKMVSAVCDTIIFLFLGMVLVDDHHTWHTGFVLSATILCLLVRFATVFFLTFCANKLERTHCINEEEQFIMAYGGLRGAVAFSLVIMLDEKDIHKNLFITATLFIVLFTVFVQGATIKPLVKLLKIRRQTTKNTSMFTEVNTKLLDHVMAGVEEVTGDHGGNYWKQLMFYYNNKYLKKWLQCKSTESNLTRVYTKMMLEDHFAHLYGPAAVIEDHKPLLLNKVSVEEEEDDILEIPSSRHPVDRGESFGRGRVDPLLNRNSKSFDVRVSVEEEDDDILEILPPVTEEEEEKEHPSEQEQQEQEEKFVSPVRSAKFDLQDPEEGRPLKSKRKRNSESSAVPKKPPLLQRQTTLAIFAPKPAEDDASKLLQKALLDNPYNKLHQKYNPNLVDDDAQELALQLRKRRLRTRRLTLLAMHASEASTSTPERRFSSDESVLTNPLVCTAASFFMEKAAQRRRAQSKPAPKAESSPRSIQLERQNAVGTSSNGAISIAEEEEPMVVVTKPSSEGKAETKRSTESEV